MQDWSDKAVAREWQKKTVHRVEYKKGSMEPMVTRRFHLAEVKEAFYAGYAAMALFVMQRHQPFF